MSAERERTRTLQTGQSAFRRRLALPLALLLAAAVAGCGLGPGDEQAGDGAHLAVTRDFGQRQVAAASEQKLREDQTVMRLLQAKVDVETRYGGRFVQSIDGLSGDGAEGQKDWFYWVNGIEADVGATDYELDPGDRVQWDYRDWRATMRIPAIVGAYPEPFQSGWEGKRRPVRVECERSGSAACKEVQRRLEDVGVAVSGSSIGAPYTEKIIRVVVGRWPALRESAHALEQGPQQSGVFAHVSDDGSSLDLLDASGDPVRSVHAGDGTGLVAALVPREDQLTWVVTGLDEAGVDAAARALDAHDLRDAFAVAVNGGRVEKLPLAEAGAAG